MPVMETISIINKSGKVVSTTKHLVNIFKDAKEAYQEKKAEIRAENRLRIEDKAARKMLMAREEVRSETSSRRSHRHRSEVRDPDPYQDLPRPPALTERALSQISETTSHHGSRKGSRHGSQRSHRSPVLYHQPYFESGEVSRPDLHRRHTEALHGHGMTRGPVPIFPSPQRTMSSPTFHDDNVDMNLAYGDIPPPLPNPAEREKELQGLMSKLDTLMVEAQCVQHSATTIISSLQANPEAMAAVALTLAEISNILTKMSPGMLTAIKGSSPAIFALLASPQFLIAGGVAVGVTIVMFGGYKIIKKIQQNAAERKEAARMDEALVFDGELSTIESWRRGIAEAEEQSVATSVDGEFITPEAARQQQERIKDRAREERRHGTSRVSTRTTKQKDVPVRTSSRSVVAGSVIAGSVSGRTESTIKPRKDVKEKKPKKQSALTVLFRKAPTKDKKKERGRSHKQPKMLEM